MHLLFRTLLVLGLARRRPLVNPWEPSVLTMRALPTDIDVAMHINNGQYFSLFDLGRFDLMQRAGLLGPIRERGWTPVVQAEQIAFRRSVTLLQKFEIHTLFLGVDEKTLYFEQRVVIDDEIYVRAYMATRLRGADGPVPVAEIMNLIRECGWDVPQDLEVPEHIRRWREETALPSSRRPAPNRWMQRILDRVV